MTKYLMVGGKLNGQRRHMPYAHMGLVHDTMKEGKMIRSVYVRDVDVFRCIRVREDVQYDHAKLVQRIRKEAKR